jgi:molybdopterin-containing oxidoreductase family membrane subunit
LYNELARLLGIVAGLALILFLWRSIIGGISSSDEGYLAFKHMIGSMPYNLELWLGLFIPSLLMLVPSIRLTDWGKVTAASLLLVGMFVGRLEFVLSGVVRPLGQMAEGRPDFVSYMPTISEILVAVFGFSLMLLLYTLGERFFKLDEVPE